MFHAENSRDISENKRKVRFKKIVEQCTNKAKHFPYYKTNRGINILNICTITKYTNKTFSANGCKLSKQLRFRIVKNIWKNQEKKDFFFRNFYRYFVVGKNAPREILLSDIIAPD